MACTGLRHKLTTQVRPWISTGKERFGTPDQLSNCGAASEFKLDDKTPGGQQHQRQTGVSQKGGDKKRNFRPSISEPMETTSGNYNTSGYYNNSSTGNLKAGQVQSVQWRQPSQLITSTMALKGNLRKAEVKSAMHLLWPRRPHTLPEDHIQQVKPSWIEQLRSQRLWRQTNNVPKVIRHTVAK